MRGIETTAAFACILVLALSSVLSGAADEAGAGDWKSIFNGRNLDGWEAVNGGKWTVEDGQIVVRRLPDDTRGGWLVTRKDYGDFIVRLKFRPGAEPFNSGVLVRDPGHAMVSRPAFHGFEIQLEQGEKDPNTSGAIYDVARAYPKEIDPRDWEDIEVRCEGDHIVTFLDGKKMAETHTRRSFSGAIGLQMHGGKAPLEYRFKDIAVKELPPARKAAGLMLEEQLERDPEEFRQLVASNSVGDTFAAGAAESANWTLQGGVLRGTGGGVWSGLLTKAVYRDFLLTFESRVPTGGEAAVAVRQRDGAGFEPGSGYLCAISELFENPSGSLLGLAPGMLVTDWDNTPIHRPGRWNSFSIYVRGDHVVTYVNLSKTADVHASRDSSGHIGFYVKPGSTAEFQHIRIKTVP